MDGDDGRMGGRRKERRIALILDVIYECTRFKDIQRMARHTEVLVMWHGRQRIHFVRPSRDIKI